MRGVREMRDFWDGFRFAVALMGTVAIVVLLVLADERKAERAEANLRQHAAKHDFYGGCR